MVTWFGNYGTGLTTIVTQLDKESVSAALREMVPKTYKPRFFRSTFEGDVRGSRLTIGYRFGWFAPPIRLVTFSGQLRQGDAGTEIVGTIGASWIFYLLTIWLVIAIPVSMYRYASAGDYSGATWSLLIGVGLFLLGRAFLRSTQDYVLRELERATRGEVKVA